MDSKNLIKNDDDPPGSSNAFQKEDISVKAQESQKTGDSFFIGKKFKIVVTFNYHNEKYGFVSAEFDTPETISLIKTDIEKLGHKVYLVEADENFYENLKKLKEKNEVDLVFNYSVGIYGRGRETHIPAFCEMLRIPCASSDAITTAFCQDKAKANDLLNYYGIKAPNHQLFKDPEEKLNKKINFPLIIKYVYQGSSIGLKDNKGVVNNELELYQRIKLLYKESPQTIMAEEYIKGREFTVGFYGNYPNVTFFPLVEMLPTKNQDPNIWVFNSHLQPVLNNVSIDKKIKEKIYKTIRKVVEIFELKDWGRIDLRVREKDSEVYILEINNCAHLSKTSVYFAGAKALGLSHEQLIVNMLNSALKRYNLT